MSNNPRDTQFAGSARNTAKKVWDIFDGEFTVEEVTEIIAQYAYDIVCHTVRSQAQGIEILCRDDPEYIRERVEQIPDMKKWPEKDK